MTDAMSASGISEPSTAQVVALVVAVARNGVIGYRGALPWHLPQDLAHFKAVTTGTALIMGRLTFESIGRPLPDRRSIVLTRDQGWSYPGVQTASNVTQALAVAGPGRVSVIGGAQVYAQVLEAGLADELVVTHVEAEPEGDAHFPSIDPQRWVEVECRPGAGCHFVTYRPAAGYPQA